MCLHRKGQKVIERFFGPKITLVLQNTMIVSRQKYSQAMGRLFIEKLVNVNVIGRKNDYQCQSGVCVTFLPHRSEQEVFALRLAEILAPIFFSLRKRKR